MFNYAHIHGLDTWGINKLLKIYAVFTFWPVQLLPHIWTPLQGVMNVVILVQALLSILQWTQAMELVFCWLFFRCRKDFQRLHQLLQFLPKGATRKWDRKYRYLHVCSPYKKLVQSKLAILWEQVKNDQQKIQTTRQ